MKHKHIFVPLERYLVKDGYGAAALYSWSLVLACSCGSMKDMPAKYIKEVILHD